ncbi:hypothetical protein QTP70_013652 [Hemibagrus guttatus]|uniref:Alkylated DNA repair protein AlkB homologue 8 N-terminal domain-containing protein n=1 Tax=Hemibagrus guttatus TaxID=175788 RepID=A0AAE0V101_9TELE|nr:hypothetical protein QTP70_013652 [Hemibagrus guttatus]
MWQGIQSTTNYRPAPPACDSDASFPDALNSFYARFEAQNDVTARKTIPPPEDQVLCLTMADVRKTLCRVNPQKSAGRDNIADHHHQTTTTVPKKTPVSCPNDYCPVSLTLIIMKCFERLVMRQIKDLLPPSLDPMQFAYRPNHSTDDAISTTLHLYLTHLKNKDTYVQMLFINFSSAFNTIIPHYLIKKLSLNPGLPDWETSVSPDREQHLQRHHADDTSMVGLISKNDESAYREEVQRLTAWCKDNKLSLNMEKTKEMVVDFRRAQSDHSPLNIDRSNVEIIKSTKFLSVHLAEDLTWLLNTSSIAKKAQQHLYFLQRRRKAHFPPLILTTFYRGTIKSILSSCITA